MRNIPGYPAGSDVVEPVVRVVHGGRDREVDSLSLSRELPSSFHEQVRGIGGLTQATGSVDWVPLADVVESHPTGFNRVGNWPPKTRDAVDVFTGVRTASGDLLAKQLTGFVSKSSGDPLEGAESGLVDRIARLSRKVTLPPLQSVMPPVVEGSVAYRSVGLFPTFYTDVAARAGGFYSTPPMSSGCVLSAPLMGSAWPERGTVTVCRDSSDNPNDYLVSGAPRWRESAWGVSVSKAFIVFAPVGNSALSRGPMEVTAVFDVADGSASVSVRWSNLTLTLIRTATSVIASAGAGGVICSMPAMTPGAEVVAMRVVPTGANLQVTLRNARGEETTGIFAGSATGNIAEVEVMSNSITAGVGGVQVSFPTTAWGPVNYKRTAFITPAAHHASLIASPPIMGRAAKDLLEEQSTAELAALWIDGDGNLRWTNRNRLVDAAPTTTLTSRDHLKSLPWDEDFAGVASQVEVTGRKAATQRSTVSNLTFWDAGTSGVEPGDTLESLIHPDTDTDWIMVDLAVKSIHQADPDGLQRFNRGHGSWIALYAENETTVQSRWSGAFASCAFVDHRTYRVAASMYGFPDNTLWEFSLKIPAKDLSGNITAPMRRQPGLSTPVIRGKGLTMWEDVTYTADAGVWDAPVLTHDVGWWVQDPAACQAIANLVAASTTTPRPFLGGVNIVPDARLQLGDVVTLSDPDITGVQFRCLLVGIDDRFTSGPTTWEQSCGFRILDYTIVSASLSDLDTAWTGQLLTALDAARDGETLAQLDAQPLKGAPQ